MCIKISMFTHFLLPPNILLIFLILPVNTVESVQSRKEKTESAVIEGINHRLSK